ncbi:MAG: T9SS type A sorting domain-containing protein [Chitinophagaceae bacterium]
MKNIMLITILLLSLQTRSQNNLIFYGGPGDGNGTNTNLIGYIPKQNIGGLGDGTQLNTYMTNYVPKSVLGNSGDGAHVGTYFQNYLVKAILGGEGDGLNVQSFLQNYLVKTNSGGLGDGWNTTGFNQNYIAKANFGGEGDGWAASYTPLGPLPVTLINFEAVKQEQNVLLSWKTSMEINSAYYQIERSTDAVHFEEIAQVVSKNNINGAEYTYLDEKPYSGYNYYRIKMVDIDEKYIYTPTRHVIFDGYQSIDEIKVYPIPSHGTLNIDIPILRYEEKMVVNITNWAGQVVYQTTMTSKPQVLTLDINQLAKGDYFLQLKSEHIQKICKILLY